MFSLGPLAFAPPWTLLVLAGLPLIWVLPQVTPPAPPPTTTTRKGLQDACRPARMMSSSTCPTSQAMGRVGREYSRMPGRSRPITVEPMLKEARS